MAQLIADRRDIDFVLYEQLEIENLLKTKRTLFRKGIFRKMGKMDSILSANSSVVDMHAKSFGG